MVRSKQEQRLVRLSLQKPKKPSRTYASMGYWNGKFAPGSLTGLPAYSSEYVRDHEWWALQLILKEFKTVEKRCRVCKKKIAKGELCVGVLKAVEVLCVSCFKSSVNAALRDVEMLTDPEQRKRFDFSEVV